MDVLIQPNLGISVFTPSSNRNDLNDTKMIIVWHFPSRNKDKVKKGFTETILQNDDYVLTLYILYQSTFLAPSVAKGHLKVSNISQEHGSIHKCVSVGAFLEWF